MKFNLRSYQKISGDEHIEKRLRGEHEKEQNEITEEQLESGRVPEKEALIEKLLEKTRTGEADVLPEKRFETTNDGLYQHRNSSAFEGDINKLEQKRLENDPVEDEKYEDASETPKQFRWWEEGGSPDGLKLAKSKKSMKRTAQDFSETSFDEGERWGRLPKVWSEEEEDIGFSPEPTLEDFDVEVESGPSARAEEGGERPVMYIVSQKYFSSPTKAIYMSIDFRPDEFRGLDRETKVKEEAMRRVIEEEPALEGRITLDDFNVEDMEGNIGTVTMRAVGDELSSVIAAHERGGGTVVEEVHPDYDFEEVKYDAQVMGGTPMASGTIATTTEISENEDLSDILADAVQFLKDIRPDLDITTNSFDTSHLDEGKLSYVVQLQPNQDVDEDFDVDVVEDELPPVSAASSSVKKKTN